MQCVSFIFAFLSSVPPKLDIDLGSTVSSVSDPDISGMSDKEPAKKDGQRKAAKPAEPVKPADESQSEGKATSLKLFLVPKPANSNHVWKLTLPLSTDTVCIQFNVALLSFFLSLYVDESAWDSSDAVSGCF